MPEYVPRRPAAHTPIGEPDHVTLFDQRGNALIARRLTSGLQISGGVLILDRADADLLAKFIRGEDGRLPDHPLTDLIPHLPTRRPYEAVKYRELSGRWEGDRFISGGRVEVSTVEQLAALTDDELLETRGVGPTTVHKLRKAIAAVLGPRREPHRPCRGSDVEAWLRQARDRHDFRFDAIDSLLADYRLRADVGAYLDTPADEIGPPNA